MLADWPPPPEDLWLRAESAAGRGSLGDAGQDAVLHIVKRRLPLLVREDHFRYAELLSGRVLRHLRAVRDEYRSFLQEQSRRSLTELHWRVFRFGVMEVAVHALRSAAAAYLTDTRVPVSQWAVLFDCGNSTWTLDGDAPHSKERTFLEIGPELQTCLNSLLGDDVFDEIIRGGPFGLEAQQRVARSTPAEVFLSGITLPEILLRRQRVWDLCQPWTECLARIFDAVQEELLFQRDQLGPEALKAEAEMGSLPMVQRLAIKHLKNTGSGGREKGPLGEDCWLGFVRELDKTGIKIDQELRGNAKATLTALRRRGTLLDTWEAAYLSKATVLLEDAKRHGIRREVTKALLNAKRDAESRLSKIWQPKSRFAYNENTPKTGNEM